MRACSLTSPLDTPPIGKEGGAILKPLHVFFAPDGEELAFAARVHDRPPMHPLAALIDHTCLKPEATRSDIERLCAEALQHHFHSVCVNGSRVELACHLLADSEVKTAAVIGFPLGATDADAKRFETEAVVDAGAHEIDMVLNIGRLRDGDDAYVLRELRDVVAAADERCVKVILETCLLSQEEKVRACRMVLDSGAQFVKTSTGFNRAGATPDDIRLLRETVGPRFGVKAAGGIRDLATAQTLIEAGANRLGTSAGVALMHELAAQQSNSMS